MNGVNKTSTTSIRYKTVILSLIFYIIGLYLAPSCWPAGDVVATYDKKTIRYPSMFVGHIWVKSGEGSSAVRDGSEGRISTRNQETASSDLKTNPDGTGAKTENDSTRSLTKSSEDNKKESVRQSETIKQLKQKRLKTIQAREKRKAEKAAAEQSARQGAVKENEKTAENKSSKATSKPSSSMQVAGTDDEKISEGNSQKATSKPSSSQHVAGKDKENEMTSEGKTTQLKTSASARATDVSLFRTGRLGKNWHHKQDLYAVECGQRLARVVATYYFDRSESLVSSKVHPENEWYHICPGSMEEKLFVELCHPTIPTVQR